MTEFYDFWCALWHDAWAPWDGLWLFQIAQRPIDRALGPFEPTAATWLTPVEVPVLQQVAT